MTPTAGQSLFGFFLRIFGTLLATIGAYIIWYIVDGKIPGVIVFLWLWMYVYNHLFPPVSVLAFLVVLEGHRNLCANQILTDFWHTISFSNFQNWPWPLSLPLSRLS